MRNFGFTKAATIKRARLIAETLEVGRFMTQSFRSDVPA
ncbi:hypothetical protein J2S70_000132 [Trueperella bonasi]|uniref:Uncharacterized protein n=1 Tax=Trueperella bonasi TaxID=312286 RepID=A0ABT9NDT2_9ACTO|nr:hypothetical protein [Trueperella bonasi]